MAEYSREQRNQLSRAIANSGTGSRQLKGFVDNRQANPQQYILDKGCNSRGVMQKRTQISWRTQPFHYVDPMGVAQIIHFGQRMQTLLDANDPVNGSTPGGGAQVDARNDVAATNGGNIFLGHLLNAQIGGPGIAHNLYPISEPANHEHLATIEYKVKNAVMGRVAPVGVAPAGALPPGQQEHVEYRVQMNPIGGGVAGSGNAMLPGPTVPNVQIVSQYRERSMITGNWLGWTQKTINSLAGDRMNPIIGGWGSVGAGMRALFLPNHLQSVPLPLPVPLPPMVNVVPPAPAWANNALIQGIAPPFRFIGYIG